MFKSSRRAAVIAASFALGLSAVGPAAHAGLLGGSDSDSTAVEGVALPLGGDLLGGDLLGGLLGGEEGLLGGLLGDNLLSGVLGGGGLPLVGALLSENGLLGDGLLPVGDVLGGDLLGGGLPLVGDVLGGGVLGGELLGGELLNVVTDTTLHCDAAIPQVLWALLGDVTEAICAPFSDGLLGLLGSL